MSIYIAHRRKKRLYAVIVHLCLQRLRVHDAVTDSTQELHPRVLPAVVLVAGTQQTSIVVLLTFFSVDDGSAIHVLHGAVLHARQ